jgi:hypothetical protein
VLQSDQMSTRFADKQMGWGPLAKHRLAFRAIPGWHRICSRNQELTTLLNFFGRCWPRSMTSILHPCAARNAELLNHVDDGRHLRITHMRRTWTPSSSASANIAPSGLRMRQRSQLPARIDVIATGEPPRDHHSDPKSVVGDPARWRFRADLAQQRDQSERLK